MRDQDKTKEQLIEEVAELRRSLDALMNNLPEGVLLVDSPDVKVRLASQDACRMIGVSREALVGIQDEEHFRYYRPLRPDGEPVTTEQLPLARVIAHGEVIRNEEWLFQVSDGSRIPIICHAGPIVDQRGEITGAVLSWQDITERKQNEQALLASERRFRAIFEQSPLGIALLDSRTGRFVRINPRYCEIAGRTEAEMLTLDYQSIAHPEDLQLSLTEATHLLEGKVRSCAWEKRYLRPDGSIVWVNLTIVPLWDEGQQPRFHLTMVEDVTERKLAEEALQKAHDELERRVEERTSEILRKNQELEILRLFAESANQGFGIATLDGTIRFLNPAMCRLMGEKRCEDVVGQRFFKYGRSLQFMREEFLPTLLREGLWEKEGALYLQDGNVRPIWNSSVVVKNLEGRPAYIATIISDITERKQALEALRHSRDQLHAIYRGIAEGLLIADIETKRFVRVNSSICRMLGYSEKELLAASVADIHPPETVSEDLQRFQATAEGRVSMNEDRAVLRKDGSVFYADISGHPIFYEGRPCLMALFRDITERRQAQEAAARQHRTLKHLLQSSDHERQTIAYEIHDELAQQLAGAIMQFQAFDSIKEKNPGEAARAYDAGMTMLRQGHREARRLIAGLRPPVLDESGVVEAVVHLINELLRQAGPQIEFVDIVRFGRLVPALENSIYRICQEALTNACRHSGSDRVRLVLWQRKDQIRIKIRDWGAGFDVRTAPKNRYGLEGIRQRAKLLGGRCSIRSKPGKGTRIVVELPVVKREDNE